jgi:hypothetical protein
MPRGQMEKGDFKVRVLKLKRDLFEGKFYNEWTDEQKDSAHQTLNTILDIIDEYRY